MNSGKCYYKKIFDKTNYSGERLLQPKLYLIKLIVGGIKSIN